MLLKDACRTKYERMSLAITVLEMPTTSIVKSLEPLRAINWTDARPWIAMLGAVILFLGWELRKKRREIQKLDLEIAHLRSQQSLVQVATIHEMNSLIKDVEEISARKPGNFRGHESTRTLRYPFSRVSRFDVCEAVNRRVVRVGRSLEEIGLNNALLSIEWSSSRRNLGTIRGRLEMTYGIFVYQAMSADTV